MCATITSVWLNERDMEHAVNDLMHAVCKMQMVSSAVHASWDFGRYNPSRYKLAGISGPQMQVSGGQEHISSHVRWDIAFVIVVVTVHKKFVAISDGGRYKVAEHVLNTAIPAFCLTINVSVKFC